MQLFQELLSFSVAYAKKVLATAFITVKIQSMAALALIWVFFDSVIFADGYTKIILLFIAILIDTLTGMAKAWRLHDFHSRTSLRASAKLTVYMMLYIMSEIMDLALPEYLKFASPFMVFFLISTEFISVLENVGALGFQTPLFLIKKLRSMQDGEFFTNEKK